MASFLCDYSFEEEDGTKRTWAIYGSYTPPRPPPWTNGDHDSPSFSDPGDPEEIEIEYAQENDRRVDAAELAEHEGPIRRQIEDDPPEPPVRGRGRRFEDYEKDREED